MQIFGGESIFSTTYLDSEILDQIFFTVSSANSKFVANKISDDCDTKSYLLTLIWE